MRSRSAVSLLNEMGFRAESIRGGLTGWSGPSATGPPEAGMFLLRGRETPAELLGLACSLEDGARSYYEAAGGLYPEGSEERKTFKSLARAEQSHKDKIAGALEKLSPGAECAAADAGAYMEGGLTVREAMDSLLADPGGGLVRALELSMGLEANALDFYMKFLRMLPDEGSEGAGGVKEVIRVLIGEEKAHLKVLGRLLGARLGARH